MATADGYSAARGALSACPSAVVPLRGRTATVQRAVTLGLEVGGVEIHAGDNGAGKINVHGRREGGRRLGEQRRDAAVQNAERLPVTVVNIEGELEALRVPALVADTERGEGRAG